MPNVSANIDTFLRSADNAAARSNLGVAALSANTFTGAQVLSVNGAVSSPPLSLTGTIYIGGSATTTKPQLLIEPAGTTSTNWSANGTLLGLNAPAGFTGSVAAGQINAVNVFDFKSSLVSFFSGNNLLTLTPVNNGVNIGANTGAVLRYTYASGFGDAITLSQWQANSGYIWVRGPDGSAGNSNRQGYSVRIAPGDNLGTGAENGVSLWAAPTGPSSGTAATVPIRVLDVEAPAASRGSVRINGTSGPLWTSGTGDPENVITAPIGSFYSRTDGGALTSFYVKESGSGNTGWVAK